MLAFRALGALALGLALGLLAAAADSPFPLRVVSWIEPVGTIWVNAIRMTVVPLIVASLVVAIATSGARTVGRLGTRAFVVFVALLVLVAAMTALLAPPLFARLHVDQVAAQSIRAAASAVERPAVPTFASWLVSLVPTNPVRAAADGAMLPLIVFTVVFALALGRVPSDGRDAVVAFFRGIAAAMTIVVEWALRVAPIGVFALALSLATRLGVDIVGAVGFYLAAHAGLLLVAIVLTYFVVVASGRTSLGRFARAALPAQVVAATTRSSIAALPAMMTSAEETLRLPRATTSFALPFAVSIFRLNSGVSWIVGGLFAAKLYGVALGAPEIATLAVTCVLMSFSVPGIPSGSLFVVAPFFAAVGIPPESIGVLIALDVIPDVFKTTLNVTGHLASVVLVGDRDAQLPRYVEYPNGLSSSGT